MVDTALRIVPSLRTAYALFGHSKHRSPTEDSALSFFDKLRRSPEIGERRSGYRAFCQKRRVAAGSESRQATFSNRLRL